MLEENPLPAVAVVIPKLDFQGTESLNTLRDRITQINGIDEVRMDDSLSLIHISRPQLIAIITISVISGRFSFRRDSCLSLIHICWWGLWRY